MPEHSILITSISVTRKKLSCHKDSVHHQLLCCSGSFNVTDVSTNRKPVCNFLLVNNTNLHPLSHHFPVIAK